jgi:hypothetical protein
MSSDTEFDNHEDNRLLLAIEQMLLEMTPEKRAEFCRLQGIDDPEDLRAFLAQDVPHFRQQLKKREH